MGKVCPLHIPDIDLLFSIASFYQINIILLTLPKPGMLLDKRRIRDAILTQNVEEMCCRKNPQNY